MLNFVVVVLRRLQCLIILSLLSGMTHAELVWTRTILEDDFIGQGLSVSSIEYKGQPAVVYRKLDTSSSPTVVLRTQTISGWITETVAMPVNDEQFSFTDALTINGRSYVAIAYNSGIHSSSSPDSLRIVEQTGSGWNTIFDRKAVGNNYGRFLKLTTFDGRIAATYAGAQNSSGGRLTKFLFQDHTGQFREESAGFLLQGSVTSLNVIQFGSEVVIVRGSEQGKTAELRRNGNGHWSTTEINGPTGLTYPTLGVSQDSLHLFDRRRLVGSGLTQPIVLTNSGEGWIVSDNSGTATERVGGSDWLEIGDKLHFAYSAGPQNGEGSLIWNTIIDGRVVSQEIGTATAGPDFNQLSMTQVDSQVMISLMDLSLPSGRNRVVVYSAVVPEPHSLALASLGIGLCVRLINRRRN